jgi:hypothetical protein
VRPSRPADGFDSRLRRFLEIVQKRG